MNTPEDESLSASTGRRRRTVRRSGVAVIVGLLVGSALVMHEPAVAQRPPGGHRGEHRGEHRDGPGRYYGRPRLDHSHSQGWGGLGFGCRYRCRSITGMDRRPPPMTRMNPMTGTNLSRRHHQTFPTILSQRHHGMTPTILNRRHLLIVGIAFDLLPALKDEQEVTPVGLSPSSGPGAIVTRRTPGLRSGVETA